MSATADGCDSASILSAIAYFINQKWLLKIQGSDFNMYVYHLAINSPDVRKTKDLYCCGGGHISPYGEYMQLDYPWAYKDPIFFHELRAYSIEQKKMVCYR
jgi:hypothetical protein